MNNNGLFNSQFSSTNPFNNTLNPSIDESLANSYARLEALKKQYESQQKNQQQPQQANVFTDINAELNNLSDDELTFITNSKEYQTANQKYQTEFSQFLISKFAPEYLQTGNTRTLEELLLVIKQQKEKYKDEFASDINEIRDQNKTLIDKNNQLVENNQNLQKQLEEIKARFWKEEPNE